VAIVGGGVAGLSAAWRLASEGLDVRLLELEPTLGGTSASGYDGVIPHPWGAHYLPVPNLEARAVLRLLDQMGVLLRWDAANRPVFDPRVLCAAPQERLFYRDAWHPGLVPDDALTTSERAELARFTALTDALTERRGRDGRFAFQIPMAESSRDPEILALDGMSMDRWLTDNGFSTPFLRWYVRYATLDDFGAEPSETSAWAGLHYFAARKLETPELEGSHFLVWPEGNGRLVRALADSSDARRTTSALVLRIEPRPRGGVEVDWLDADRGIVSRLEARAVVVATPAFVARRILPPDLARSLPTRASSPWLVANLHVNRPRSPDQAWDSVLFDAAGLGYVDASHQLTPPRSETVLTYFRAYGGPDPRAARAELLAAPWENLAWDVMEDLRAAHPDLRDQTTRLDVTIWGHAMPRPEPGFLGPSPFEPSTELGDAPVVWGHADAAGIALFEEAQAAGLRAAESAARHAGIDLGETWL
jgi:protoporphyrinogen oxidase